MRRAVINVMTQQKHFHLPAQLVHKSVLLAGSVKATAKITAKKIHLPQFA
jgi:hypothetical protein